MTQPLPHTVPTTPKRPALARLCGRIVALEAAP